MLRRSEAADKAFGGSHLTLQPMHLSGGYMGKGCCTSTGILLCMTREMLGLHLKKGVTPVMIGVRWVGQTIPLCRVWFGEFLHRYSSNLVKELGYRILVKRLRASAFLCFRVEELGGFVIHPNANEMTAEAVL